MLSLIEKEYNNTDKILKPDFNQKTGRELLAFYLQTKFKQMLSYDRKCSCPLVLDLKPDFISKFSKRLINNPNKRLLIGITGESACGKSTLCGQIEATIKMLGLPVSIICADNYFNDISELIKQYGDFDNLRDNGYDVDSPESFQLELFKSDLEKISQGQDIKCPKYLANGTGISLKEAVPVQSQKVIVVEGMATMYKDAKDLFDVKIYVEANCNERKERFFRRAAARNQDQQNAQKHWDYIQVAAKKYIRPFKNEADMTLSGDSSLEYFAQILEYIHAITNNFAQ